MECVHLLTAAASTPLQPLYHSLFDYYQLQVWIKRDDMNHPVIQGNKWHKLRFNLQYAKSQGMQTLITFGGAYSNHIAATAAAGKAFGFKTVGIIRGEELAKRPQNWSPTLQTAYANGMRFQFIDRQTYRLKNTQDFLKQLQHHHPHSLMLPEGGSNERAMLGFQSVIEQLHQQCPGWSHLFTAVGTGGTLAGLAKMAALNQPSHRQRLLGVATLNQADFLQKTIRQLSGFQSHTDQHKQVIWQLLTQYSGGGYAKTTDACLADQHWFEGTFGILLDPIYTNKMVHGFLEEMRQQRIPPNAKVILYHSGGLQGRSEEDGQNNSVKTD